jgi:hypothetical protein
MEVVVAVQSGTLLHPLRVQLKRRVSARRGGDYSGDPEEESPIPGQFPSFSFLCHTTQYTTVQYL